MERRSRALHRFLVGSPIALLIAVGLVAHIPKPPYPHSAGDKEYDRHVLAYRERVTKAQALRGETGEETKDAAIAEARAWVAGYASGELVPIPAASYEDHIRDGVRGEITRTGLMLSSDLAQRAEFDLRLEKAPDAADEALLASEVAFGLRNFDTQVYIQALLANRRGLGILAKVWPMLPAPLKQSLGLRIKALTADPKDIDRLMDGEEKNLQDYLQRQKLASLAAANDPRISDSPNQQEAGAAKRSTKMNNERVDALFKP